VNFADLIQTISIYAIPAIFAITLHEAAHGIVAYRFGDKTAWMMGRVSLNPMTHIDLMGTIIMPIVLFLATSGNFLFGYAKPVPVRFGNLRHPKRDMIWVALAGPASNFLQALLWGLGLYALLGAGLSEPFFLEVCKAGLKVNVIMCVFNLFPLPPLDGGRILTGLLAWKQAIAFARIEPWGFFIVMGLVVFNIINALWMTPLMGVTFDLLSLLLSPFEFLLPK
jgi:Zn-dependent protease